VRYISQYPYFKLQIRPQRQEALGDGGVRITQEHLIADFTRISDGGMIFETEITQAIKHFDFRGNTQMQDEATPSDPMNRLSVFDSDVVAKEQGWDADTQAEVEAKLDEYANLSVQEVMKVTGKPIQPPFPNYDIYDGDPEALAVRLQEDGHDFENVLYYEETFGPRRPEVIAVLRRVVDHIKAEQIPA